MIRTVITYGVFVAAIVVIGATIGINTVPGEWYATLIKPWFSPPNWLFGPVWTVLYILIGCVGARKWMYGGAVGLWWGQMALNFLWSPVFFAAHQPFAALLVIIGMWLLIALFIRREWNSDRVSAVMFLPYLAWVSLATALNTAIVVLN